VAEDEEDVVVDVVVDEAQPAPQIHSGWKRRETLILPHKNWKALLVQTKRLTEPNLSLMSVHWDWDMLVDVV
jgi:hypothetical protein